MSSTPLQLKSLRQLADQGFDLATLVLIQHRTVAQVIAVREAGGQREHPRVEVMPEAEQALPRDAKLYQLYNDSRTLFNVQQVGNLEKIAADISLSAEILELQARQLEGRRDDIKLGAFATMQGTLANRLAQLIEGARSLEARGLVSVNRRLDAVANPSPQSALGRLYVKAQAIMAERATEPMPRVRMAA